MTNIEYSSRRNYSWPIVNSAVFIASMVLYYLLINAVLPNELSVLNAIKAGGEIAEGIILLGVAPLLVGISAAMMVIIQFVIKKNAAIYKIFPCIVAVFLFLLFILLGYGASWTLIFLMVIYFLSYTIDFFLNGKKFWSD